MTLFSPKFVGLTLSIAAACLLSACSDLSLGDDVDSIFTYTSGTFSPRHVTLEQAAATPYASLGMRIGRSSEVILVLATVSNETELWTSSARVTLSMRAGRIVQTAGLSHNMTSSAPSKFDDTLNAGGVLHFIRDFPDLGQFGVNIDCRSNAASTEEIVILGKAFTARRIEENCETQHSTLNWSFKNIYWVDPKDGMVWRSSQHISPKMAAIKLEVFRPPTRGGSSLK